MFRVKASQEEPSLNKTQEQRQITYMCKISFSRGEKTLFTLMFRFVFRAFQCSAAFAAAILQWIQINPFMDNVEKWSNAL